MDDSVQTETQQGVDPEKAREGLVEPPVVEEVAEPESEDVEALAPPPPVGRTIPNIERVLAIAMTQQGMKERPCPSNDNKYSEYFGFGAQYWCADFVSWCFDRVGNQDRRVPWGYPSGVLGINEWARRNGLFADKPQRGDIFTYADNAHVGLVTGVRGGRFRTIEGNTAGPDGTVCWVAQQTRDVGRRYRFIRFRP